MNEVAGISNKVDTTVTEERIPAWSFTHVWTTLDVCRFIRDIGYCQYSHCFMDNMINGRDLKKLNGFDLQRIGVHNMEDAMRMHTIIKRVANKAHYNFQDPDKPPNVSYTNTGSLDSKRIATAKPFYLTPIPASELKLPFRNAGTRYERYHMSGPTIQHQRSICTRKRDDSMAHATLYSGT